MENPENETKPSPTPETPEITPPPEPVKTPKQVIPPKAKTETRAERALRLTIRYVAGFLIVFGLGIIAVIYLLYRPQRQQLENARADFARVNQQVADLQNEVTRLKSMESQNQAFQNEIGQRDLHISILKALADVQAARAALALGDNATAQTLLTTTSGSLPDLQKRLSPEQQNTITSMQSRINLIKDEIGKDSFAAQSDLGVLASTLEQLEKANFGTQ